MFWLSTRKFFRDGDLGWASYVDFISLPQLREVRTIDGMLNQVVSDGNVGMATLEEISAVLPFLPQAVAGESYYLLFADADRFPAAERPDLIHLGYDLSDETWTSSLLNCGVWENELAPIAQRVNKFGLLSLEDARLAQSLLPQVWSGTPHASVTIWALYELIPT
jgi:hypothetical protein